MPNIHRRQFAALRVVAAMALGTLLALPPTRPVADVAAAPPPGFTDTRLVDNVSGPTAIAFTPDGRMLITSQAGQLRVFKDNTLTTALDFTNLMQWPYNQICGPSTSSERGLLGVAVDPAFATNNFIYVYYTFRRPGGSCTTNAPATDPVNRVSRFVLPPNNSILTTTQTVLVDNIFSTNGNHNGGDLQFGKDGYLYISTGDSGGSTGQNRARAVDQLSGKILRIDLTGADLIPATNPYASTSGARRCGDPGGVPPGSGPCQEIIAFGMRNPFRIAFDPNAVGTRFFINDVGQNEWEEIDEGTVGGVGVATDYGWSCREGAHTFRTTGPCNPTPPNMVDPIFEYPHDNNPVPGTVITQCNVITGGAFVPDGLWPGFDGAYLFADNNCGTIFTWMPGSALASVFMTGLSAVVHLAFGPFGATQALYYTTYASGGEVHRVALAGNGAPTAVASANPTYGALPLNVTFSAAGSSDPEGDPLSFTWDFGDGVTTTTTLTTTMHQYNPVSPTAYTATLRASDGLSLSVPAEVRIFAGDLTPPVPTITSPLSTTQFAVGQTLTVSGQALDAEDGPLPNTNLRWTVLLHHIEQSSPGGAHTHPILNNVAGNDLNFTSPNPEGFGATALSYVEIQLTAFDLVGLASTITQTLQPNRVNLTFATVPGGLQIIANATTLTATATVVSWENYLIDVSAPGPQFASGQWWVFANWSDGGAAAHTILTPSSPTTYTATFQPGFVMWLPSIFR